MKLHTALLSVAVAACSQVALPVPSTGGGSSGATPSQPAPPSAVAVQIVELTNRERSRAGRSTLARSDRLMRAAQIHAEQMAAAGRMEHTLPGAQYPTLDSRLQGVGYQYGASAENISWNQPTAAAAMAGWMRSSGHSTNILSATYTQMGGGYARSSSGQTYYVQVFGRPR